MNKHIEFPAGAGDLACLQEAQKMLDVLDTSGNFTFQTFDDDKDRKSSTFAHIRHGSISDQFSYLNHLNVSDKVGIFVTINETDLEGRKAKNVKRVRAVFVDFDKKNPNRLEQLAQLPLPPTMVVESSPEKHHAYWVVNSGEIAFDVFRDLQKALIQYFAHDGADKSVHDLPRVLRLAGFFHKKEEPYKSNVVHIGKAYSAEKIINWVKSFDKTPQRSIQGQSIKSFEKTTLENVRQALKNIPSDDYATWLGIGAAIYKEFGADGFSIFDEWSRGGASYSYEACCEKFFNESPKFSKITIATIFHLANQNRVMSDFENVDLKKAEVAAELPEQNEDSLPPLPEQLKALPGGLGHLQVYVYNTMTYPCLYTAGWVALATMAGFAQSHLTINSLSGLGFNEYFLTLAPTGFGKESLRDPLNVLLRNLDDTFNFENLPTVEHSAPSSKQGLHQVIQSVQNHSVYVQSDEFAEWLKGAKKDPNKHAALSYLMEIYSKANRTIHPGRAVSGDYKPIQNPRLSVFSTTTAESLLSTLDKNTAEMGAYNRWVMYVAPTERIQKKYTGLEFEPRQEAIEVVKWVAELESQNIKIDKNAFDMMVHFDSKYAENIKFTDAVIGGRITEQAIKIAGLFALSDQRTTINAQDMQIAYEIRLGLYYRAKEMINQSGAISGSHETGKALEQLREKLKTRASIYLSQLHNFSRAYEKLDVRAQDAVIQALIREGAAQMHPDGKRILVSLICK